MFRRLRGKPSGRHRGRMVAALGSTAIAVALAGCSVLDDLVGVDAPSRIEAASFETPGNATVLRDGVVADFECALAHHAVGSGLTAGEFQNGGGFVRWASYDLRVFEGAGLNAAYGESSCSNMIQTTVGIYVPLSTARWQADNFTTLLGTWTDAEVPDRSTLIAIGQAYSGYAHLLLGESMCSAAFDNGPEETPAQVFARAEERFTQAIATATAAGSADYLNMARIGRARTRLDLGRYADAASDAALVPAGYSKVANYSSNPGRRVNQVYALNQQSPQFTVAAPYRNVMTGGVPDPRVSVTNVRMLNSAFNIPLFSVNKYPGLSAPIRVGSYREAQLIRAEAAVRGGNSSAAVGFINVLRAASGLPDYGGGTDSEVLAQIVAERAAEFFAEGHRLEDIRRFDLPLVPAAGTPYPLGGTYGSARCYPLPDAERLNNPNID